jgi:hypothetical protein
MSIGSINAGKVSADAAKLATEAKTRPAAPAERASIADHVASADEHEPIRSASTTQGTLIDTYL